MLKRVYYYIIWSYIILRAIECSDVTHYLSGGRSVDYFIGGGLNPQNGYFYPNVDA